MKTLSITNEEVEKKSGYAWKIIIFGLLGTIWSLAVGFLLARVFQGGVIVGLHSAWWFLLFLLILTINFILESIFADSSRWIFVITQGIALSVGFYLAGDLSSYWLITIGIIPLAFLFFGRQAIRRTEEDMMKIRWHRMVSRGTALFLTGLIIFSAVNMGVALISNPPDEFFFSKESLGDFLESSDILGKLAYKDFSWQMNFIDFAKGMVVKTTKNIVNDTADKMLSGIPIDLSGVIDVKKQEVINQGAIAFVQQAEQFLKIKISGDDSLLDVAYNWLAKKFQSLSELTKKGFIIGAMILLFLILKAIAPIFSWIARSLAWLVYQLLTAIGFASMAYEMRSKEAIVLN